MNYLRRCFKYYLFCLAVFLFANLYFLFLLRDRRIEYLTYFDILLGIAFLIFAGSDFFSYRKKRLRKEKLLRQEDVICDMIPSPEHFENREIAEHDIRILKAKIQEQFQESCELQDYVAKWCHEFKIPLSTCLLIDEKIEDGKVKRDLREPLERMNRQINTMMLGCRLQSPLFDLQVKRASLQECVKTSVRNNQFFLIRKKFALDVQVEDLFVYTDPAWLVYILDQMINNALKYSGREPKLHIWSERQGAKAVLFVEDNGEGIRDSDIKRIFEKGFTGDNYHNGKYKSTGMGLYMVSKIAQKLEHEIKVESEYGIYTRFSIEFS